MARINTLTKSNRGKEIKCPKCGKVITAGMKYLKATPYHRADIIRCISCGLKSWETSGSDYVQTIGSICDEWRDSGVYDGRAEEIAEELEELKDSQQESLDNMPENLQYGSTGEMLQERSTGEMLQERIDELDGVIDELNEISWDDYESDAEDEVKGEVGDWNESDDEISSEEEWKEAFEEKKTSYIEEQYGDAIAFEEKKTSYIKEQYGDAIDEALGNLSY